MLDLKLIRTETEQVVQGLGRRGKQTNIQSVLEIDKKRRELLTQVETLKAQRNKVSKQIPLMKKQGEDVSDVMAEMKGIADTIKEYDARVQELDEQLSSLLLGIPNIPHESVPTGADENDNTVVREYSTPTKFDFEPKAHWDIGRELQLLDPETAARVTGARFMFYLGMGARMERSIMNFMLDVHTQQHGYTEVIPPFLANESSMRGTGQLPKFAEDMYKVEGADYYLIPTAEVPITNMFRETIVQEELLPIKNVAYSPCFRAEAGSAGRDTRGLIRLHQFDKVELVKFTRPEQSYEELEKLTADAERILQLLEIPYRVVTLCTGDMGFSAAKTYDIEVWMPSYNRYVEISSCSNCEDFQARRANIRFRDQDGKMKFVHTLNGSGLAVGRTLAAVLENYQQADGSIKIPEALQPYVGRDVIRGQKG